MKAACNSVITVLTILTAAALSPSLAAHHSFAAEFDGNKPLTLRGVVTKVDWRSPHIWVYFDVKAADGTITSWQCEGGAPNALTRQGWTRKTFEIGAEVIVDGWEAKDGTHTCNAKAWTLGDGRRVLAGSSAEAAK